MERRGFLGTSLSPLLQGGAAQEREYENNGGSSTAYTAPAVIERAQAGKPHRGKTLAAIQPHCDDIPIYAGGTILKLIDEGYTGDRKSTRLNSSHRH